MKPTFRAHALLFVVAVASASMLASVRAEEPAQERDLALEVARGLYQPAAWPRGELRVGFDLGALELDGYGGGPLEASGELVARRFLSEQEGASGLRIELRVADDLDAAREQLLSWLAGVSSAEPVPRSAELGIEVGDVGFVGRSPHGEEFPHWIGFVRGNMALRLSALDLRAEGRPSLAAIARRVDALIAAERKLAASEAVPHPVIEAFSAERERLTAGESTRLSLRLVDARGGEPRSFFILGGPGTGYVERAADGSWTLYTTGPGSMELRVDALGSNGTFARRSIAIEVAPE